MVRNVLVLLMRFVGKGGIARHNSPQGCRYAYTVPERIRMGFFNWGSHARFKHQPGVKVQLQAGYPRIENVIGPHK